MSTISQILKVKGRGFHSVGPDDSVYTAVRLMAEKNVGSVLVIDRANLVGILTERDYARNVVLKGRTSPQTRVRDIMSTRVACVELFDTVEDCMSLMTDKRVRHLPVVEDEAVVGIVSIGDLVKSVMDEQRCTIRQLETYFRGELYVH